MNFPFDTSLKLTDVGWSGLARIRRGVGCHESHNSHPRWQNNETNPTNRAERGREERGGEGCGHVCCEWIFVFMPQRESDAKETFTNEVVIGSCSFAAQPVRLALPFPPWQPSSLGFHNKLSDNCTNCQGGNAARDSSTFQRFQRLLSTPSVQLVRVDD